MGEHEKEIPELCDDLRRELTNFYESKVLSLERDCDRYRKTAKVLAEKNNSLKKLLAEQREETEREKNRADHYRELFEKERKIKK